MFSGKFVKKNGKLVFDSSQDKLAYEIFLDKIPEGQKVEMLQKRSPCSSSLPSLFYFPAA